MVLFRLPCNGAKIIKAKISYRMIDIGFDDAVRDYFEYACGNAKVYLAGNMIPWLYVDSGDRKRLWPESPFVMREKNYTIVATFKVRKLLFDGYSIAEITDTQRVAGIPEIPK